MGKKGNKDKLNTRQGGQRPTPSSSTHPPQISHSSKPKVLRVTRQDPEIVSADVLYACDKSCRCEKEKCESGMTNDTELLCEQVDEEDDEELDEEQESEIEKAERRRRKKERQKEKKLVRKMAAKRKESELSIGDFLDNDQGSSPSASLQSSKRAKVSLCRHPLTTLEYFLKEIPCLLCDLKKRYVASRRMRERELVGVLEILLIVFIITAVLTLTYLWIITNGPLAIQIKQYISWYLYWIFLGVLSSVGLGTGLHTFILYLGPFIAKVSLAAQECASLDFPQPPYPNQIICPIGVDTKPGHHEASSILDISAKVRWETLAWGFGTALGELPPYFIARAASIAGDKCSTENLEQEDSFLARVQLKMRYFVMKVGFWGILLCASIPNPLFDLAGITCGHFQVPFAIFFGATAIGKTIVKSQLQMLFVILAFNDTSLKSVLQSVSSIPRVGPSLRKVLSDFIDYQRATLHNQDTSQSGGVLKIVAEIIVILMIIYFVGSIINGLARSYQKRIAPKNKKTSKTKKRLKSQT